MVDSFPVLVLALIFGLCVGSFLNVLSLRTLLGQSIIWPPSHCPACGHSLAIWENIPLISYVLLKGRCRSCQTAISLQYPLVELVTAVSFVVLVSNFGLTCYALGLAFFVSTLIAVTITDIHERLIPHDITYPSMLVGIAFSAYVRHDLVGAMVGIGASYIIFDFLAHYGLKLYIAFYGQNTKKEEEIGVVDPSLDSALDLNQASDNDDLDDFEVMGGGDAVLSAVISAWLGWQRLVLALVVGFMVGTIMGLCYLIKEMHRANILAQCLRPCIIGAVFGFCFLVVPVVCLAVVVGVGIDQVPWLAFGLLGATAGCILGVVSVGSKVSKPFPFGPALAAGGFTAIFFDPIGTQLTGGA